MLLRTRSRCTSQHAGSRNIAGASRLSKQIPLSIPIWGWGGERVKSDGMQSPPAILGKGHVVCEGSPPTPAPSLKEARRVDPELAVRKAHAQLGRELDIASGGGRTRDTPPQIAAPASRTRRTAGKKRTGPAVGRPGGAGLQKGQIGGCATLAHHERAPSIRLGLDSGRDPGGFS